MEMMEFETPSESPYALWWQQRKWFVEMGGFLCAPLPFAIAFVVVFGFGSAFIGLMPGADTLNVELSGVGTPWIGLVVLFGVAALWYWRVLRHGYPLLVMGVMTAIAVVIELVITDFSLNVLVVDQTEPLIAALGAMGWLMLGLLGFMGLIAKGLVDGVFIGLMMGIFMGLLAGFPLSIEAMVLMTAIYCSAGGLVAGTVSGVLRPMVKAFIQRRG